ncbi:MAG: peptidoglycan DD-metalloendopeptidase family protein [candidate division WOR-3 bacterium]|nr:peptidoglycan DD-metalloendopeptidase family protein [candidate division WOR-3 bacterium]
MIGILISILIFSADYEGELKKVEKDLEKTQKELETLKKKAGSILEELERIDVEAERQKKKLSQLEKKEKKIREKIELLSRGSLTIQKSIDEKDNRFNEGILLFYRELSIPPSTDIVQCRQKEENIFYLNQFLKGEKSILDSLSYKKNSLLSSKNIAQDELKKLLALQKEEKVVRNKILAQKKAKRKLVNTVKDKKREVEKLIAELKRSREELEEFMRRTAKDEKKGKIGKFIWPSHGTIISNFGTVIDPVYGTKLLNNGIDIRVKEGLGVVASHDGKVVYASRFYGYGNIVIIDHENGYHTLYAHLSNIEVMNGEKVKQGEIIGRVGTSGTVSEPTLHFEIRRDGRAINPLTLLK